MELFLLVGGIMLAIVYSGGMMASTVWVVQATYSGGIFVGMKTVCALALSQLPWVLMATVLLFSTGEIVITVDPGLRLFFAGAFAWMAFTVKKVPPVLRLDVRAESLRRSFRNTLKKGFLMPWRWVHWSGVFLSVSIHHRQPGIDGAIMASIGALMGLLLWNFHFIFLTALFGKKVPAPICLKSINKLRLLAFIVFLGLAIVILGPLFLLFEEY